MPCALTAFALIQPGFSWAHARHLTPDYASAPCESTPHSFVNPAPLWLGLRRPTHLPASAPSCGSGLHASLLGRKRGGAAPAHPGVPGMKLRAAINQAFALPLNVQVKTCMRA